MWALRTVGCLLLLLALICVLLIAANWHTASIGGHNLRPLAIPSLAFCLLGFGIIFRRRSAALATIVGSIALATWLIVGSALHVPMPWLLLNVAFAILVLLPAGVLILHWKMLSSW